MSETGSWPAQAYLDVLRPQPAQEVAGAIITSYSADIVSIVAALLALSGRDNDEGTGGKADLAEAVELLRGKVRILIQRGRLARPTRIPSLAGILDQFIREIDFDEAEGSWHPKIALVRLTGHASVPEWRFWVGSKNLTAVINRDFGMMLSSAHDPKVSNAHIVPGTGEIAARLATHARLAIFAPNKVQAVVNGIRWIQPDKLNIERITLTSGKGTDDRLFVPPSDIDEVFAVSPFLDGATVKTIGSWGGPKTRRILLSTRAEVAKIAGQASKPLTGFQENIFVLDGPPSEPTEPTDTNRDDDQAQQDEHESVVIGLHAKLLSVRKSKRLQLWVGSANATQRAWTGRNVEVVAELSAPASVLEGLNALLQQAQPISATEIGTLKAAREDPNAKRLEAARKRFVASWKGRLNRFDNAFVLASDAPPHPTDSEMALEAGLATASLVPWPRTVAALRLGQYELSFHTHLVQFRLSLGPISCSWLQAVDVLPPLAPERDHHAIARHLGVGGFLQWIGALLTGNSWSGSAGDTWDKEDLVVSQRQDASLFDGIGITLDAMLACWARDRTSFKRVSDRINIYLDPLLTEREFLPARDIERLHSFHSVWKTVSAELLKAS